MNSYFESPVQTIHHPLLAERKIQLSIKRDDLIHPQISGNKWRKLKFNLDTMQQQGKSELLTFGGHFQIIFMPLLQRVNYLALKPTVLFAAQS